MEPTRVLLTAFLGNLGTPITPVPGSQGPNNCATASNDATVGEVDWNNLANVPACDGVYAGVSAGGGVQSHYLLAQDFGFSLPTPCTITGIEVWITRRDTQEKYTDASVSLFLAGLAQGEDKADAGAMWPALEDTAVYGHSADTWGLALLQADVASPLFGVGVSGVNNVGGSSVPGVDCIQITVYYTAP